MSSTFRASLELLEDSAFKPISKPNRNGVISSSESTLVFMLPLLPPSVNHYKVRRYYSSPETKAFIDAVAIFSGKHPVAGPMYDLQIFYYLAPKQLLKWDVDNFGKVSCDALHICGVIPDDRYVMDLGQHKRQALSDQDVATLYAIRGRSS